MKKLLSKITLSIKFFGKVSFLIILVLLSWIAFNIAGFIKGKQSNFSEKDLRDKLLKIKSAKADVPPSNCGGDNYGGCPHVAYFDGKEFKIENDFLPSEFKTLEPSLANIIHKWNAPAPDMLKLSSAPQKYNGALTLRLQEIELEESFVQWIKLLRVVHSAKEEIVIDASTKTPYLVRKKKFEKKLTFPASAVLNGGKSLDTLYARNKPRLWKSIPESRDDLFQKGDSIEFVFKNIEKNKNFSLVLRSVYRDWMAGEEVEKAYSFSTFIRSSAFAKIATFGGLYFLIKSWPLANGLEFLPFVVLGGCGDGCGGGGGGGGGGGDGGGMCSGGICSKSIYFSYRNVSGKFTPLIIQKPRSFRHGTEIVSLPKEAIGEDNSIVIKADFTKWHRLSFIGVAEEPKMTVATGEELSIKKALHSRLGDVTSLIKGEEKNKAHLIPGDTVEVSFKNPIHPLLTDQKETYLFQSAGFYSALRPEYKQLAGNWQEKLSGEAKKHLASLTNLKDYE